MLKVAKPGHEDALRKVERILKIARGMVGGRVEGVEAEPLGLDFGAFDDGESGLAEDAAELLAHESERMGGAGAGVGRGQRGVDGRPELGGDLRLLDTGQGGIEKRLQLALGLVDELAQNRLLLLRRGTELLHERSELAVGSDVAGLGGLEFGTGAERGQFCTGFLDEDLEGGLHDEERLEWNRTADGKRRKFTGITADNPKRSAYFVLSYNAQLKPTEAGNPAGPGNARQETLRVS